MVKKIKTFLSRDSEILFSLFIANLLSNCAIFHDYNSLGFVCFTIFSTCLLTLCEHIIYLILPKMLRKTWYVFLLALDIILILIDYYLILSFDSTINERMMFLLFDTNPSETANFFSAYFDLWTILSLILGLFLVVGMVVIGGRLLSKFCRLIMSSFICVGALIGLFVYGYSTFNYIKFGDGLAISQYTTFTRISWAGMNMYKRYKTNISLIEECKKAEGTYVGRGDSLNVVVVIGEAHSIYHSSLYGYPYKTNPLLEKRRENGECFVFSDAITAFDATHEAMRSIFSTDSLGLNFGREPLFPAIFKKAGFKTILWDNEYLTGTGINFMSNIDLSNVLYDYRNTETYSLDEQLIDRIPKSDKPYSLYIVHLVGHHFDYSLRYPKEFSHFTPSDYDSKKYTNEQRVVISDYDNATLYNDYIIDKLCKKFENEPTILVYFSDHGEEVYEIRDFHGHTNAQLSPDLRYQIRIPFVIWLSPLYMSQNPAKALQVKAVLSRPVITDDIPHLLMDLADISSPYYSPYRSVINNMYQIDKPRMILNNAIDFDSWHKSMK